MILSVAAAVTGSALLGGINLCCCSERLRSMGQRESFLLLCFLKSSPCVFWRPVFIACPPLSAAVLYGWTGGCAVLLPRCVVVTVRRHNGTDICSAFLQCVADKDTVASSYIKGNTNRTEMGLNIRFADMFCSKSSP